MLYSSVPHFKTKILETIGHAMQSTLHWAPCRPGPWGSDHVESLTGLPFPSFHLGSAHGGGGAVGGRAAMVQVARREVREREEREVRRWTPCLFLREAASGCPCPLLPTPHPGALLPSRSSFGHGGGSVPANPSSPIWVPLRLSCPL